MAPERLLSLEEALAQMFEGLEGLPAESVALADSLGRVLAQPVRAKLTLPPWDNSAMDGFAVRAVDVTEASRESPVTLPVRGEVAAGHAPSHELAPASAVRILTGAMLPPGADAVVPVEETDAQRGAAALPGEVTIYRPVIAGEHVRRAGSDIEAGTVVLDGGARIDAAAIAVLAATGWDRVKVTRRPRVAILSTGDELIAIGQPLREGQIHDSNGIALAAQVAVAGGEPIVLGSARDELATVVEMLRPALGDANVVIVTGGVSVGVHDVVKEAFGELGRVELWRVAVQPGKPLAFGRAPRADRSGDVLLFGLPGNPVSAFVTFELFVRPVLRALLGAPDPTARKTRTVRLAQPVRKSPGRRAFLRVRLESDPDRSGGLLARLAGGQGSHVLSALAAADALAVVPEDRDELPAGAEVEVWELER